MKILLFSVTDSGIYRNRQELIKYLIKNGHSVVIVAPMTQFAQNFVDMGCQIINIEIKSHSKNLFNELKLILRFWDILKEEKPDRVLTYTIKPNIYCGILCGLMSIPSVLNITGLGEGLVHYSIIRRFIIILYRLSVNNAFFIFFQNNNNLDFFIKNKILKHSRYAIIPGSGVNLSNFHPLSYPVEDKIIRFLFVSRIVKDKGIDELIEAIRQVKKIYKHIEFHIAGSCSTMYEQKLKNWVKEELIIYHGKVDNIISLYQNSHCLIHPSHHEGMANVILESSACCRPCIVSNIPGCIEAVDDGITGFIFSVKSTDDIVKKILQFISLSNMEKKKMGLNAREKMEKHFDRQIIVTAYIDALQLL